MSHSQISSSGSRTPASSMPSPQSSHSDTTPSPSGGNKFPPFDPHDLASKLAFLEASESLAQVAETLSVAAKAMSRAAASFAAASGYNNDKYNRNSYRHAELRLTNKNASADGTESPEWQQHSYTFPALTHASGNNGLEGVQPRHDMLHELNGASCSDSFETTIGADERRSNTTASGTILWPTNSYELEPSTLPSLNPGPEYRPDTTPLPEGSNDAPAGAVTCLPQSNTCEPLTSTREQRVSGSPVERVGEPNPELVETLGAVSEPKFDGEAPTRRVVEQHVQPLCCSKTLNDFHSELDHQPNPAITEPLRGRIVLDSGFDEVPMISALAKQHPKIICFCKYWAGATPVLSAILNKSVAQAVMYPTGLKQAARRSVAGGFMSSPSAILFWPANKALPDGPEWHALDEAHIIHLGEPMEETAGYSGSGVTIVITQKSLNEMGASARNQLFDQYPIDHDSDIYNQQGPGSRLHAVRMHTRARYHKNASARGLYLAWLNFQRSYHPDWTAEDLVGRANVYAEEHLLRGEPMTRGFVGGRIPLTSSEVRSMGLQPAVDAGILTVS